MTTKLYSVPQLDVEWSAPRTQKQLQLQTQSTMSPLQAAPDVFKFLLLHPKATDDVELARLLTWAREAVNRADVQVHVKLSRDDYFATFERLGGWSSWVDNVVSGCDFASGAPCYNGYIAYALGPHGAATAGIVKGVLTKTKKPVAAIADWPEKPHLVPVSDCFKIPKGTWKAGWWLR